MTIQVTHTNGILRIKTADESLQRCFKNSNERHGSSRTRFVQVVEGEAEGEAEVEAKADYRTDEVNKSTPPTSLIEDSFVSSATQGKSGSGPSSSLPPPPSTPRGVTFDKITIRNYNRTIADNPSCSSGVPVGLSWEYDPQHTEISVDTYESGRRGYRRDKEQMRMPEQVRLHLLRDEFDVSMGEMLDMACKVEMSKRKRKETLSQSQRRERVDKIVKSANRGFRKMLSMESKENDRMALPTSSFQRMLSVESEDSDQKAESHCFDIIDVPVPL